MTDRETLTLRAQAFGPLRKVEWTIPPGLSVVVGPNRVGKSTLLALPEFLRLAVQESVNDAVLRMFGGPISFRTVGETTCTAGMTLDGATWQIGFGFRGQQVFSAYESLSWQGRDVLVSKSGAVELDGRSAAIPQTLPAFCASQGVYAVGSDVDLVETLRAMDEVPATTLVAIRSRDTLLAGSMLTAFLHGSAMYRSYEYFIQRIQEVGSLATPGIRLSRTGDNVLSVFRNWKDKSATMGRCEFVISSLQDMFPQFVDLEFELAGQTIGAGVVDRRHPNPISLSRESTGFVTALLQLCAVASTPGGGIVTIDEPETSLHPHAIEVLTAAIARWADEHHLRVVFATQSQTVLDQFADTPERVFVIEPGQAIVPRCLTDLFDADYLKQFSLGNLFAHLEFGGHRDYAKEPG